MKTDLNEIDEGTGYIGYGEAFDIIGANVWPVGDEALSLKCNSTRPGRGAKTGQKFGMKLQSLHKICSKFK